jgi:hypothetical protein
LHRAIAAHWCSQAAVDAVDAAAVLALIVTISFMQFSLQGRKHGCFYR